MFLALTTTLIAKLRLSKLLFVFGAALEAPDVWSKATMDLLAPRWGHSDWGSEDGADPAQNACIDIALILKRLF